MPYYPEKNLLFIHIPKTGGQNIEKNLSKNTVQLLLCRKGNSILPPPFNSVSLQHQFFRTLHTYRIRLRLNFNCLKIFTIVRNPYDRIMSALFWNRLITKDSTCDDVFQVLKNQFIDSTSLDNHNKCQYEFLTNNKGEIEPSITIFRCETLNKNYKKIATFLNTHVDIRKQNVNKNYMPYLNKQSINLINTKYAKDFEYFQYPMIDPETYSTTP